MYRAKEAGRNNYQFVTAVNGVPVAGRYDASLMLSMLVQLTEPGGVQPLR